MPSRAALSIRSRRRFWRVVSDFVINDCRLHPPVPELRFGGVGNSGMGKYHEHWGSEGFANARRVLYHSPLVDASVRDPPYSEHQFDWKLEGKLS